MKKVRTPLFLTRDPGLLRHWQAAFRVAPGKSPALESLHALSVAESVVWVDLSTPGLEAWDDQIWKNVVKTLGNRIIAASSNPGDEEALSALDNGCLGYCHAYSDAATLNQVQDVVQSGNVWIGRSLMQRLLSRTSKVARDSTSNVIWSQGLTSREIEVSVLAANGASNQSIAEQCQITERTVKAHLSAAFEKLQITDRLQLALRVHGIH